MRERFWHLPVKIALPVLMGQFLSDWLWNKNLAEALHRFPMRATAMLAVFAIWAAFRRWRFDKKNTFR